jgi:hypothetical protein
LEVVTPPLPPPPKDGQPAAIEAFIDYSQYKVWCDCRWRWYERYVNQLEPQREARQQDNPMTLGSLVHAGLDAWASKGQLMIDDETIADCNPTPECHQLAMELLAGYVQRYPEERWAVQRTEQPLVFELPGTSVAGLAKLDRYFYLPEQTTVESGLAGTTIDLAPGWWVQEYKTKACEVDRALWMKAWSANMQADFQLLALGTKVGERPQGVLVQVLEKPRRYVPKRKCKGCGEMLEMAMYLPAAEGESACPLCGAVQRLKPYEPKTERHPEYYRVVATRTEEQLARSLEEIAQVAHGMHAMRLWGLDAQLPNRDNCCIAARRYTCDYFDNHTQGIDTLSDPKMVKRDTTKYVGLEMVAEAMAA